MFLSPHLMYTADPLALNSWLAKLLLMPELTHFPLWSIPWHLALGRWCQLWKALKATLGGHFKQRNQQQESQNVKVPLTQLPDGHHV